jgi:predicted deacylase
VTSYGAVQCTVDFDRPGRHVGHLELPRSTNTSGWSHLFVPIAVVANGDGPTVLVLAGNHGDEYEGQIAALGLLRGLDPAEVSGSVVIIPCLSPEASLAGTRLWPSGANFNRSFPGRPDGAPDEQLAWFLTTVLMPMADVVIDIHTGGRSARFVSCSHMHWVEDPAQRRRMAAGMFAWNTDHHLIYVDIAGSGLLPSEAERQGKTVVTTELGGGGYSSARNHGIARRGLANVLRHVGVLAGEVETRSSMGLADAVLLDGRETSNYLLAPESGLWETLFDPGDVVAAGQPVGRIHFVERPEREPVAVRSPVDGVVACVRAIVPTQQGDNVLVVGTVMGREELLA